MSDYLHENAVKKMLDDKPTASNFVFAEVTVRFPIDKDTKFPVKIFTEDDTKEMILEVLTDIGSKIEMDRLNSCRTDFGEGVQYELNHVIEIIDNKIKENKNGQNS